MKNIFLYLTIAMLSTNCTFITPKMLKTIDYNEPLISVYGKVMNRQYIDFLEKEDSKFKITRYSYYINPQKNIVRISGGETISYDLDSKCIDGYYSTSEDFRKGASIWAKKYYKMIDVDFVNMDNKKKMEILDNLVSSATQTNE